jgi:hypothetical protein
VLLLRRLFPLTRRCGVAYVEADARAGDRHGQNDDAHDRGSVPGPIGSAFCGAPLSTGQGRLT